MNQNLIVGLAPLKMFKDNDNIPHILFTVGIFDEGVDIECIDAVFFQKKDSLSRE